MASDDLIENTVATAATSNMDPPKEDTAPPLDDNVDDNIDEETAIKNLTTDVRDQDALERDITLQAAAVLRDEQDKKDQARIEKLQATKARLEAQRTTEERKLQGNRNIPFRLRKIQADIDKLHTQIKDIDKDIADFQTRIATRRLESAAAEQNLDRNNAVRLPGESRRDYLVRTGKITPFAQIGGPSHTQGLGGGLEEEEADAEAEAKAEAEAAAAAELLDRNETDEPQSHQILRMPGFAEASEDALPTTAEAEFSLRPRKRRRVDREAPSSDEFEPAAALSDVSASGSAAEPEDLEEEFDSDERSTVKRRGKGKAKAAAEEEQKLDLRGVDDGNEAMYQTRLEDWVKRRSHARRQRREAAGNRDEEESEGEEWFKPAPDADDHHFDEELKLPGDIHPALFSYQKTGVRWLAELYTQQVGGIVGDEMGLGKTVQVIAFIAALHYSKLLTKPVIVVTPATVLRQWVDEFHRWWPPLRVSILHSSGSGLLNVRREDADDLDGPVKSGHRRLGAAKKVVQRVQRDGHVLLTTYSGLHTYADELVDMEWAYAVLDEGHKIRNPNAEITVTCKMLNTPNRVILSGTPIQNNLSELWSLFDFIYPMRLGTLVDFRERFENPIRHGSYTNATNLEIIAAEKCAETLKQTVSQYLLQRLKIDVAADLPEKTEQVLFCKLTESQTQAYELFLRSEDCQAVMDGRRNQLYGIDVLRKICNHPDLLDLRLRTRPGYDWGNPKKSGKMQVVQGLLQLWKRFGHRTLLFSQSKLMLNVLESLIGKMDGINHLRMDGETPVHQRQALIGRFNADRNIHVFLLTTRTGGLGVNLTGADRIIIFDPDWNPSTDMQARERAWRLGQTKSVSIYRLVTSGTIEEKMYHRQIFKQYMTDKVLKDPKQRASFNLTDLFDLFSLGNARDNKGQDDRNKLFRGAEVTFKSRGEPPMKKSDISNHHHHHHHHNNNNDNSPAPPDASYVNGGAEPRRPQDETRDVERMASVAGLQTYDDKHAHDEKRMIEGIFARSVDTAYEHEKIVNGKRKVQADLAIITEDANRIAARARAHLRQAEADARRNPVGTVTWTGEVGEAGRREPRRRGRGRGPVTVAVSSSRPPRPDLAPIKPPDFKRMITQFIKRERGGRATTQKLINRFDVYCTTEARKAEFKQALSAVAEIDDSGGYGRGVWTLKAPAAD
ncbi:hypothetical protein SODALDRAFT_344412 [Sodiomyces alkalinus F11]|uniref:DNA repair and recombination protein RAD26 n=1 Tax=Sodiomyces alkalinus (strain CBS 110278 / VKM F-3762 / F11) TaxID=1314773 RepID=A0A3N2PVC3_SODAK|nr:hypothetical protein SODALDRAFT_344412 [Sodiomyces alkalinus F11]ROT38463.1 hypothetical protein SODALDRAFT_344412 [Sodiomyces alkalinus F11]